MHPLHSPAGRRIWSRCNLLGLCAVRWIQTREAGWATLEGLRPFSIKGFVRVCVSEEVRNWPGGPRKSLMPLLTK
jgi:hypothetical protein